MTLGNLLKAAWSFTFSMSPIIVLIEEIKLIFSPLPSVADNAWYPQLDKKTNAFGAATIGALFGLVIIGILYVCYTISIIALLVLLILGHITFALCAGTWQIYQESLDNMERSRKPEIALVLMKSLPFLMLTILVVGILLLISY